MAKKTKSIADAVESKEVRKLEWEGNEYDAETVSAESDTKLEEDKGTGQEIILRFFDFAANPETFKQHKPTAQELFNTHRKGIESLLWTDGLTPYQLIEPRLLFSKDGSQYRFAISCIPSLGNTLIDKTKTLSELLISK